MENTIMPTRRKYVLVWMIGMMSGFTLMISGNTLNFWLAHEQIDIRTIGIFALITLPYAINFLWAPIFDTVKIPYLSKSMGLRLPWIIVLQVLLSSTVYMVSQVSPSVNIITFGTIGLGISFLASAQDTVLGALRTEIISSKYQGAISGTYIFGYRIGMLISGYGAIYVSSYIDFSIIYEFFSLILLTFPILFVLNSKTLNVSTALSEGTTIERSMKSADFISKSKALIGNILRPVGSTHYITLTLIFLIIYRLPDNFISMMANPFLIKIGYSNAEIANAGKLFGVISAIIGGLIASHIMTKRDLLSSLIIFGSIHAVSHLAFLLQEVYGKNIYLLFLIVAFEGTTGGMTMAAYIGFIASLCKGRFKATQYSFFSSMMGLSRSLLPAISGYIVASTGWVFFFIFTFLASLPPLALVWYIYKVKQPKEEGPNDSYFD